MDNKIKLFIVILLVSFQFMNAQEYKVEVSLRLNPTGNYTIRTQSEYFIGIRGLTFQAPSVRIPTINNACNEEAGYTVSGRNSLSFNCDFIWDGALPSFVNTYFEGSGFTEISRKTDGASFKDSGSTFSYTHSENYGTPISPCQTYTSWDNNSSTGSFASSVSVMTYRFVPTEGHVAQFVGGQQTDLNLDTPFQLELTSGISASWQYTLDDSVADDGNFGWVNMPSGERTLEGLGITLADIPPSGKIRFRGVVCSSNGVYSTIETANIIGAEAPDLIGLVNPIAPTCHYSGTGTDGTDGGFTATFAQEIGDNRKLVFIVYSEGPTDVFDTIEWSDEVRQSDLDNGTFTYNNIYPGLIPGDYRFKWMTGPDVQNEDFDIGNENVGKTSPIFSIPNPNQVEINVLTGFPPTCSDDSNGSITVNAVGGTGPYTYLITPDRGNQNTYTTGTITGLGEGTYSVQVMDNNECLSQSQPITITALSSSPTIDLNQALRNQLNEFPFGESSITLGTVSGGDGNGYSYSWKGPNGFVGDTRNLTGLRDAGTYNLIITSGGCVSESYDFIINPLSPLVVNFNVIGNINCIEDTAEIQAQVQGGAGNYLYSWNTGLTTKSIIAERGTYTLTVRDELNNEVTETFTLNLINSSNGAIINEPLSVVVASTNNIVCYGTNTGIIELTIEGGADPYQVFWDGSFTASSAIRTDFSAGDHYYTVIDSNGCEVTNITTPINIIQPANAFTVSGSGTDATSNGGNEGTLTIILANGEAPYNYIWTKDGQIFTPPVGSTDTDLINLETGNYQVIATDAIGCEASLANPIFIDQPGPLSIGTPEAIINPVQCFGASDGRITANYTGTAPFNFTWFNEANQPLKNGTEDFIDNLDPGNYYYIINDNSTALPIQSNVLSIPIVEPLNAEFTITNTVSCNNGNDGSLTITNATGGNGNYQYQLNNGILQNSPIFENLVPGTYTLTLYDENCSFVISNNIVLDNPTLITLDSFQINPITAFEGTDGAITIEVSGGEGIYNYSWTGPGITGTRTTKDIDNLSTGNYVVEITTPGNQGGIDGCYLRQEFFVNEPGPLSITLNQQNNISCFGANDGSILTTVVGEAPIVYIWSETNTGVLTTTAEDDIENLPPGTYTLTVTDASTTPAVTSAEITITEPDALTGEVFPTDASCADETDGSIIVNAIGGTPNFEYSLDNGANYQPDANINGIAAGNYTVRVRDTNGCTIDLPFTINAPLALGAEIVSQSLSQAGAADGAISLVAFGGTGNLTYAWTGPNGFTSSEENNLTGLVGGTYQLTLTDDNGCVFVSDAIEIAEPGELIVSISQTILLECYGDTFGEITANFQGGVLPYTFQWFDNSSGNENALSEDTSILGDLPAGSYFLRITDGNGISRDSNEITITEPELLEIELISTTPVLCSGESTGAIDITVSGGTLPYTYSWDTGALTEDLNNIPANTYNFLVTDANGCFTELNVTVDAAPDAIQIANISVNNLSDYQSNDGSIAVEISGGATPYAISWIRNSDNLDFGSNTTINNLTADSYTISVTDNNGCGIFETYEVTQPDIVEETITPPTCTGESNGSISLLVNKGNGNFTYSWSTGETTNTINDLPAGGYTVTILGFGDGPLTRTYVLEDPLPIEVDLGEDRTLCVNQVLDLDATVADATATYNWTSDTGFSSSSPLVTLTTTGNYTVTVLTESGCTAEGSIFVDISTDEIDAEFAMSSQVFVNETLIVVDISFPLPDTLEWVLPENTTILKQDNDEAEIVFNEPGEYDITIITSRGACIATKTKKVIVLAVDPTVNQDLALQSEGESIKDFLVYPNPNNGLFTVDVTLPERGNMSVKIFNFANNSMIAIERANGQSEYNIPFDISGLPTGVYAVVLETPNGSSLRKLVVR